MKHPKIIAEAAQAVFTAHPSINELYVTENGNAFMKHAEGLAVNHARSNGLPAPVRVLREEVATDADNSNEAPAPPAPEAGAPDNTGAAMTEGGEGTEAQEEASVPEQKAAEAKKKGKKQ